MLLIKLKKLSSTLLCLLFQLAQAHREHYTDKTGTVQSVDYFNIPESLEAQMKRKLPI